MSIFKALLQGVQSGRDGGPPKPLPHPQEHGQWHTHFHLPGSVCPMGWGRGVWVVRHPCPNGELLSHGMGRLPIAPLVGQSTAQLFGQGWRTTKQQHNYNCPAQVWTNYNCPSLGVDQSNTGNRMPTWSHGPWDHKSNYRYID